MNDPANRCESCLWFDRSETSAYSRCQKSPVEVMAEGQYPEERYHAIFSDDVCEAWTEKPALFAGVLNPE